MDPHPFPITELRRLYAAEYPGLDRNVPAVAPKKPFDPSHLQPNHVHLPPMLARKHQSLNVPLTGMHTG
jgi:hypothetical protein